MTSERLIGTKPTAITGGAASKINKNRGVAVEARVAMLAVSASDRKCLKMLLTLKRRLNPIQLRILARLNRLH
ncbi:MAG: hypothetical protein ACKOB7_00330 [Methylocystis sp.]